METGFDLQHANLLAYLTYSRENLPPRVSGGQLLDFVNSLTSGSNGSGPLSGTIDKNERLHNELQSLSYSASELVRTHIVEDDEFVDEGLSREALRKLRQLFRRYAFFGLPVGIRWGEIELEGFWKRLSVRSNDDALLFEPASPHPDTARPRTRFECYDPSPVLRPMVEQPQRWPGVLFWERSGTSAFVPVREASSLYQALSEAVGKGHRRVAGVIEEFGAPRISGASSRLVQISDPHFGSNMAARHQAYLTSHLVSFLDGDDILVVTGDLADNPRRKSLEALDGFLSDLESATDCRTILVPGNTDQRWLGTRLLSAATRRRLLGRLKHPAVDVDDGRRCIFFRFDSGGRESPLRGRITSEQLEQVGTEYEARKAVRLRLHNYLRVALVHHHPLPSGDDIEPAIVRFRCQPTETFSGLENAEAFLQWCADQHVALVLHGHKHEPRNVRSSSDQRAGPLPPQVELAAIGCGSSLAVRNKALCYNIVNWSPSQRVWSCSFYASRDSHSGFNEQLVTLESIDST